MKGDFLNTTIQIGHYYKTAYMDSGLEITVKLKMGGTHDIIPGVMISSNGQESMLVSVPRGDLMEYLGSTLQEVMPEACL